MQRSHMKIMVALTWKDKKTAEQIRQQTKVGDTSYANDKITFPSS